MTNRHMPFPFIVVALVVSACLFPWQIGAAAIQVQENAPCSIAVTKEYILPVCELASTLTEPEIIKLANGLVEVLLVPNRGRVLFDYIYKPTGVSYLHTAKQPIPFVTSAGHVVEFGGYYLGLPWNERDRQPYDLKHEILRNDGDGVSVRLRAQDPATGLSAEILVGLVRGSARVDVSTTLRNELSAPTAFIPSDHCVMAYPVAGKPTSLWLSAKSVVIGESNGSWLGKDGQEKPWPQKWYLSSAFTAKGEFVVPHLENPFVAIVSGNTGFVRGWNPGSVYKSLRVFNWGNKYADEMGGEPYIHFTTKGVKQEIAAGGSFTIDSYLYAGGNLDNVIAASKDVTVSIVWDAAKKLFKYAVASPVALSEAVKLKLTLMSADGKELSSATSQPLSGVKPVGSIAGTMVLTAETKDLTAKDVSLAVEVDGTASGAKLLAQTIPAVLLVPYKEK